MGTYATSVRRMIESVILRQGEDVSVYRNSTKTTQVYAASCQPLTIDQVIKYNLQDSDNLDNDQPHLFVFPHLCDVRVGDVISYNSYEYRVASSIMSRMEALNISLECVGVRQ